MTLNRLGSWYVIDMKALNCEALLCKKTGMTVWQVTWWISIYSPGFSALRFLQCCCRFTLWNWNATLRKHWRRHSERLCKTSCADCPQPWVQSTVKQCCPHQMVSFIKHQSWFRWDFHRQNVNRHTYFINMLECFRSLGSSVSIVSGYGLDNRTIEVRSPAGAKKFSSSLCVQKALSLSEG
jgi:hypothetical protein